MKATVNLVKFPLFIKKHSVNSYDIPEGAVGREQYNNI